MSSPEFNLLDENKDWEYVEMSDITTSNDVFFENGTNTVMSNYSSIRGCICKSEKNCYF